jgi:hypothetical protein
VKTKAVFVMYLAFVVAVLGYCIALGVLHR